MFNVETAVEKHSEFGKPMQLIAQRLSLNWNQPLSDPKPGSTQRVLGAGPSPGTAHSGPPIRRALQGLHSNAAPVYTLHSAHKGHTPMLSLTTSRPHVSNEIVPLTDVAEIHADNLNFVP